VRATPLDKLPELQRSVFNGNISRCEMKLLAVPGAKLADASAPFFASVGAPADRRRVPCLRPALEIDVGGPGWAGVRFERAARVLVVPGALGPPAGDELVLALRFPGRERPVDIAALVVGPADADAPRPAAPAGFALLLDADAATCEAIAATIPDAEPRPLGQKRQHPRYAVKTPVHVMPGAAASAAAPAVIAPAPLLPEREPAGPVALLEYATEQELAADFIDNLSQGGAFVRTGRPSPVGAHVTLRIRLPGGDELVAPAIVAMVNDKGMGVKFELDDDGQARLAAIIARISARPRRALVVDDDEVVRQMLQEALQKRGFDVLTAGDGAVGFSVLSDELLALDLLVTDVKMPGMDGERFIRTIRRCGGEADLAIVVVTGAVESGLELRLGREGADAVLDKALGADLIAQAADAVLERKRLARA
jgi:CheY-like chemotaxis protein